MRWSALLALLGACATADSRPAPATPPTPPGFWEHWGDGKAELAGYRLTQPRYGEARDGTAVHITVTEDFTRGARVKSDGGHRDRYPVVKLNAVRDFQTGIYDYNLLTSTFVPLDGSLPAGQPTKLSFSSQEWCGHVYDQLIVDPGSAAWTGHSYFQGEADRTDDLAIPADAVFADAMPLVGRGFGGELLAPGERREVPWLEPLHDIRFSHRTLGLTSAALTRSSGTRTLEVPAGSFEVYDLTATLASGATGTWSFAAAPPHILVGWETSTGESGLLTGVMRDAYWAHSRNGEEDRLEALGLAKGALTPPTAQP
jgi:hypothetical protein